jgi:hypothetical protein
MRNRFRSSALTLAVLSSLSVFAGACSDAQSGDHGGSDWSGPVGNLGLQLQLAPGVALNTIEYEISGPGLTLTGSLDVPGNGTTFNATISEIPAGNGLTIKLRSVAAGDAGLACAGQATFNVTAGQTTQVDVVLSCDGLDLSGSASINGSFNICPSVTATTLSPTVQAVGGVINVSLSARDVDNAPEPLSYAWATNTGTLSNATTTTPSLLCTQAGPVVLTYTVRDGACVKTGTLNATCGLDGIDGGIADAGSDAASDGGVDAGPANPANIVVNEIESNGGTPDDWIELYNKGSQAVDVSNWVVRDNDDSHNYSIPAGTTIQPGGYYVIDIAPFFGLGGADSVRLYLPGATTLVDSYSWSVHATATYGRCPDGLGAFGQTPSTKGSANACGSTPDAGVDAGADAGSDGGVAEVAWPGSNVATEVDSANTWSSNLSGLSYQAGTPNVLWAVQNSPSKIFKLVLNGAIWASSADGDWGAGKTITFSNGVGAPDSEGISVGTNGWLYVSTERDNNANTVSKLTVLQFDPSAAGSTLNPQREWNLTSALPPISDANKGLEAVVFIPDAELTALHFKNDDGSAYNAGLYAQNGGGVFAVGVENDGMIHLFALDHSAALGFTKLASFASGFTAVMDLYYDPITHYLWAWADDTVGNKASLFEIEQATVSTSYGKFVQRKIIDRPTGLPNSNNEGFTIAPDAQCTGGFRAAFWSDDNNLNSHSLRQGQISCGKSY